MSENPFEAPQVRDRAVGVRSGRREDLKSVAIYQKGILVCVLVYILAILGQFLVPMDLRLIVSLVMLFVGLTATVFVVLLAMKVYNVAMGIVLGLLTLVPLLGLFILLLINAKATKILRSNGLEVGLLGADLSRI